MSPPCPLCLDPAPAPFAEAWSRRYLRCPTCRLTFMHPDDRPPPGEERARYETHDNDPDDAGYRRFLDRLAAPLVEVLEPGMEGLDYGSGPGPALSLMMGERGFPAAIYDPFFAPDPAPLERRYDFVTCSETAEHFFHPGREFRRLHGLLRSPGHLAVMTRILSDDDAFAEWWYVRDPTHVAFYRPETLEWIAAAHPWRLDRPAPDVAIFSR